MSISSPKNQNSSGLNAKTNHKSAKFQAQSQAQAISKQPDPQAVLSGSIHTPQQHALMGQAELWARWIAEIELRKKQGLLHAKHETGEDPADGQATLNLTADQLHPQSILVGDAAWPSSDPGFVGLPADR
ncbi:MAG: hypothetical protein FJY62_07415, partial [Betaproteobacteria bacterium]|nr:hypothetical protein [Betaproteobacteria bacterium]